ncbi:unnamed protein product [Thelazia callipaeda]|uniref:Uncharacterized protein n=1 Tax=Thelazia callipaeda TaxID=103827 RepID=A0A3P7K217_THECL|nr:unnamed protein product [Thelazia callipaeda]
MKESNFQDISEEANYVFQDALESPRSYSSDSSKQPKSILKQPSVPLFSSSVHSEGDDTLERRVERVHINENENSEEWILKNRNQNQPKNFSRPTGLGTHFTSESQKYYHEIPKNMKQHSETPTHLPQASFNGPFFTLEEVQTRHKRYNSYLSIINWAEISDEYHMISENQRLEDNPPTTQNIRQISSEKESKNHQQKHSNRSKSVSIIEMNAEESEKNNEIKENILHWSTQTLKGQRERARSVPPSLKTRNIMDPDQIDEYRRQKKLELEAMRRREEETMFWRQKQARFLKMQEQLFYEQFHADKKEISANFNDSHEELRLIDINAQRRQQQQYAQESIEPQFIRVYETRPIMAVSEVSGSGRLVSTPNQVTWKRMYIVDSPKPVAKNEIITSEQLLEKERFDIDLLKRREAFIEKPKIEPTIFRTGKRWKPPPEQPFIWPNMRILANSEKVIESSSNYSTDSAPARTVEGAEFRWQPFVYDPEYKREHKNFIVEDSPPSTPRGFGPGSLDEPAKRQIKHLIQPLPDGSHRPKPAFGGPRATPSGGFHPHAPNAVKVLRKKLSHSTSSLETGDVDADKEVEIIHQRRFHRLGDQSPIITTSGSDIAEWEKIYDLPPHSSTITPRDTPQNVNVRGKLAAFEHALRQSTPFMQHRINVSEPHRRPTSSMRTLNIESNLHSPKNAQFARNDQHRRYERQASSSNGFLLRRMDQREKVRPMISANNYQQEQSRRKALPQDYTNNNNTAQQHNIIQSAPSVHHRQLGPRVFPARRLKRIPLEFSNNRRDHSIIVTEAQPSRIIRTNHQR